MRALPLLLFCVAAAWTVHGQVTNVWQVGLNDGGWPAGNGGGPNTSFLQENGGINPMPGNPVTNPAEGPRDADNDYYFSGIYSSTIPSVVNYYGPYAPVGLVAANEEGAERAFAAADLDLRYHFNLPTTLGPNDFLIFTWEPLNLDLDNGTPDPSDDPLDPRHGAEVRINGVLVQPQVIIRPGQLNQAQTTIPVSLASVNAVTGPGADNIVSLVGFNYHNAQNPSQGGGNWMGIDYVQLDSSPVPEPSTAMMVIFGAMGALPFLRRRRG